jgi:adenine-specific DNA-methyltransferase
MTKEEKFFVALRDVFVGAKVEGESGYINLMRIKARYYETGVFPKLQQDINDALKPSPAFRDELFEKLYDFFHRYFSESGSIYFRYTPLHQNVYEKVYTDDKDVMLFWKTHMLYYVKTDRLFRSLDVELDGTKFHFDASMVEHKKANEKRDIVYVFKEKRKDTLVFEVAYSERGRITKVDDILRTLRKQGVTLKEDTLDRAFRVFEKQSEVDYFINKDAKAFLEEQFNLWLYQYVFSGVSEWTETRISQLQTLKDIAFKIIAFISQFENELVKIWNKPKFVLNSNYVITLDRVAEKDIALVEKLLAHKNLKVQIEEWRQLGIVDASFKVGAVLEKDLTGKHITKEYQHLPIDTKFFKDLELEILGLFDNLDDALDGRLVKSENYQALATIQSRFRQQVKCIYIDPPYNTDASEILYANDYKHSSWLTLIENRIECAWPLLTADGILCVAIDDSELSRLQGMLLDKYGEDRLLGVVAIRSNPAGRSTAKGFSISHDYAVFLARSAEARIGRLERTPEQLARYDKHDKNGDYEWVNFRKHGGANALRTARPRLFYPIYVTERGWRIPRLKWDEAERTWIPVDKPRPGEERLFPIAPDGEERTWKWGHETALKRPEELTVRPDQQGNLGVYMKSRLKPEGLLPSTFWDKPAYSATDHGTNLLKRMFGKGQLFSFPKSVYATADCLKGANVSSNSIVLDFFAGSGTTGHAVINLNRDDGGHRKYILIEMAEYFDSVLLPRIKKAVFCGEWKDGKAAGGEGVSHFLKYCQLEQYEEALRRANYGEADLFDDPNKDPYHQYVFLRDLKMLEAMEVDTKKNTVKVDLSKLYDGIDIAETLSNLTGKWIKRITADSVEFGDGEVVNTKNLDWKRIKPLIWW